MRLVAATQAKGGTQLFGTCLCRDEERRRENAKREN
jgi:hypothetical protein